jgi:hypothetical protein
LGRGDRGQKKDVKKPPAASFFWINSSKIAAGDQVKSISE